MNLYGNVPARTAKIAVVTAALCASMVVAAPANAATTPDEARADRLAAIAEKYEVGDELSPQDARFIEANASRTREEGAGSIAPLGSAASCFRKSKIGGGNGSGTVDGCHGTRIGPGTRNNWMVGYTASGNANVTKIKATERIRAYGLVGSGGIGLVYAADPTATVNGRSHKFSRSASFGALAAYMTAQYDVTFYTPRGSFNVSGG